MGYCSIWFAFVLSCGAQGYQEDDSGWFYVQKDQEYTRTHGLGAVPTGVTMWASEFANGDQACLVDTIYNNGMDLEMRAAAASSPASRHLRRKRRRSVHLVHGEAGSRVVRGRDSILRHRGGLRGAP